MYIIKPVSFHPLFNIEDMMINRKGEEKLSVLAVNSSLAAKPFTAPLSDVPVPMEGCSAVKYFCYHDTD